MDELEFSQGARFLYFRELVDCWRNGIPERFPESMIPEDIQDQVVEMVDVMKCAAPIIYYCKGRRYLDREEWVSWFTKNILTHCK